MTTIAVCDGIMAADTQGLYSGIKMKMLKIFRIKEELLGVCGNYDNAVEFIGVYKKDKKHTLAIGNNKDKADFDYLVFSKRGLFLATGYGPQVKVHEKFFAIGSGQDAALTAMRMGASAKEAVKMAHLCDPSTGPQVQEKKL